MELIPKDEEELHLTISDDCDEPLSPLLILHWFCVQKNMPVSDEKALLRLLSLPMFNINAEKATVKQIRQQMSLSLPQISHDTVLCSKKGKNESNIKAVNVSKFHGVEHVDVYSVRDHLTAFLADEELTRALIFKPVANDVNYSSFVSGNYFHNVVENLPLGVLPLCRKITTDQCLTY